MKTLLVISGALVAALFCNMEYAQGAYDMSGSGTALSDSNNPAIYQSVLRMSLSGLSGITSGTLIIYGNGTFLHATIQPHTWSFSYGPDGSFHGKGMVKTTKGEPFNMTLDGRRELATTTGSMWRVDADMQGAGTDMMLSYLVSGTDPHPSINFSQNATVIIPNGNAAVVNKASYMPLNLEIMRQTTVTWYNEDNVDHDIQSQDNHGNVVEMFNSPILHTGDSYSYTFAKPGVYHYFCTIHPWRIGVVTVS